MIVPKLTAQKHVHCILCIECTVGVGRCEKKKSDFFQNIITEWNSNESSTQVTFEDREIFFRSLKTLWDQNTHRSGLSKKIIPFSSEFLANKTLANGSSTLMHAHNCVHVCLGQYKLLSIVMMPAMAYIVYILCIYSFIVVIFYSNYPLKCWIRIYSSSSFSLSLSFSIAFTTRSFDCQRIYEISLCACFFLAFLIYVWIGKAWKVCTLETNK